MTKIDHIGKQEFENILCFTRIYWHSEKCTRKNLKVIGAAKMQIKTTLIRFNNLTELNKAKLRLEELTGLKIDFYYITK